MPSLESYHQDFRYALRVFRREPGVSVIAIIILALGIGANTAVFSIVNPLLLRQLPFPEADRLVWIANTGNSGLSGATFRVDWYDEFQRNNRSFESLSAYFAFFGYGSYTLTGHGDPERLVGVDVAPRFFETLGVSPALDGSSPRTSTITAAGPARRRRAAHAPRFSDKALLAAPLRGRSCHRRPGPDHQQQAGDDRRRVASNLRFLIRVHARHARRSVVPADLDQIRPWGNTLAIVGRLRPGVDLQQARGEFATLVPQLMDAHKDWGRVGARLTGLKDQVSGRMRASLILLWGAVGTVLLIVCANLANLLLARASSRSREFAVRMALGANRARLVRQLLMEGVILAIVGAALGIPLAFGLTSWLIASDSMSLPLLHYVRIDTTALIATAAIACLTGVLFAAVPALRVSAVSPQSALQEHGRGTVDSARQAWIRRGLVVAEIALAGVLLVGAGLLARSLAELLDVDLGFEPSRAVAVRVDVPSEASLEQQTAIGHEMIRRVSALPGVEAAGRPTRCRSTEPHVGHSRAGKDYGPGETPIASSTLSAPATSGRWGSGCRGA